MTYIPTHVASVSTGFSMPVRDCKYNKDKACGCKLTLCPIVADHDRHPFKFVSVAEYLRERTLRSKLPLASLHPIRRAKSIGLVAHRSGMKLHRIAEMMKSA